MTKRLIISALLTLCSVAAAYAGSDKWTGSDIGTHANSPKYSNYTYKMNSSDSYAVDLYDSSDGHGYSYTYNDRTTSIDGRCAVIKRLDKGSGYPHRLPEVVRYSGNEYPVRVIGTAFLYRSQESDAKGCTEALYVPGTVTVLEAGAFREKEGLMTGLYIEEATDDYARTHPIIHYGSGDGNSGALARISRLDNLEIKRNLAHPEGDETTDGILQGCHQKVTLYLYDGCKRISRAAFKDMHNLYVSSGLDNWGHLEIVEDRAFEHACNDVIALDLPKTIWSIGKRAFVGWEKLEFVHLYSAVGEIHDEAFADCGRLHTMVLELGDHNIYVGNNPLENSRCNLYVIGGSASERTYVYEHAGSGVKSDGCLFSEDRRTGMLSGQGAFVLQDGVVYGRCRNYSYTDGTTAVQYSGDGAVALCYTGDQYTISFPTHVSFADGSSVPVIAIGEQFFTGSCSLWHDVEVPSSVKCIEKNALRDKTLLNNNKEYLNGLILKDAEEQIVLSNEWLGSGSGLTRVYMGRSVTTGVSAGNLKGAFENNMTLQSLEVGSQVRVITPNLFKNCSSLGSVTLRDGLLETIGGWAFMNCTSLREIGIPNSVQTIQVSAFNGCNSLAKIDLGVRVCKIESMAFKCPAISHITVHTDEMSPHATEYQATKDVFQDEVYKNSNVRLRIHGPRYVEYMQCEPWKNFKQDLNLPILDLRGTAIVSFAVDKAFTFQDHVDTDMMLVTAESELKKATPNAEFGTGAGVEYIDCPGIISVAVVSVATKGGWGSTDHSPARVLTQMKLSMVDPDKENDSRLLMSLTLNNGNTSTGAGGEWRQAWSLKGVTDQMTGGKGCRVAAVGRRAYVVPSMSDWDQQGYPFIINYYQIDYTQAEDIIRYLSKSATNPVELKVERTWDNKQNTCYISQMLTERPQPETNISNIDIANIDQKTQLRFQLSIEPPFNGYNIRPKKDDTTDSTHVNTEGGEQQIAILDSRTGWSISHRDTTYRRRWERGELQYELTPTASTPLPKRTWYGLFLKGTEDIKDTVVLRATEQVSITLPHLQLPQTIQSMLQEEGSVRLNMDFDTVPSDRAGLRIVRTIDGENKATFSVPITIGTKHYELVDPLTDVSLERSGDAQFRYEVSRENMAESDSLYNIHTPKYKLNEVHIQNFDATNKGNLTVELTWKPTSGIWTPKMRYRLQYNNQSIYIYNRAECSKSITVASCVPTTFTLDVVAIEGDGVRIIDSREKTLTIPDDQPGNISKMTATKGYYYDRVEIDWVVDATAQNFSRFRILRRGLEDANGYETELTEIANSPGQYNYHYTDQNCTPGIHYVYTVQGLSSCNDSEPMPKSEKSDVGFAQQYGVISGQVTYQNGQPVEGVHVLLEGDNKSANQFRAMHFGEKNDNHIYDLGNYLIPNPFYGSDRTDDTLHIEIEFEWNRIANHDQYLIYTPNFDVRIFDDQLLFKYNGADRTYINLNDSAHHIDLFISANYTWFIVNNHDARSSSTQALAFKDDYFEIGRMNHADKWTGEIKYVKIGDDVWIPNGSNSNTQRAELSAADAQALLGTSAGTVEMWIRPNELQKRQSLLARVAAYEWHISDQGKMIFNLRNAGNNYWTEVDLTDSINGFDAKRFNHVAATYGVNEQGELRVALLVNGVTRAARTYQVGANAQVCANDNIYPLYIGTDGYYDYRGMMDEIRFWRTARTEKQIKESMSRILSGAEMHLTGYYRCDDDISGQLVDLSQSNGHFHSRHMTTYGVDFLTGDGNTPTSKQLSPSGLTDANGIYIVNAIPYKDGGSLYKVIPEMGLHTFSPSYQPLYFNQTTNTHNAVNFVDVSSFPVSGDVYYEGTNYPVEGVNILIDSVKTSVQTNAEGHFEVRVPIGRHSIMLQKDGHTFAYGGRYPEDANKTFECVAPIRHLQFFDNTLVCITGRVAGGSREEGKPHGFGLGKANIGQATVVLTLENQKYDLNTSKSTIRRWTSPEGCTAMTPVHDADSAKMVVITTDAKTGEFSAMLPPVVFTAQDIRLLHSELSPEVRFDLGEFNHIDLRYSGRDQLQCDSMPDSEGKMQYHYYRAAMDAIYHQQPYLEITQVSNDGHLLSIYGDTVLFVNRMDKRSGMDTIVMVQSYDERNNTYRLGAPVFTQGGRYIWLAHARELYINRDDMQHPIMDTLPLTGGLMGVSNQLASQQYDTVRLNENGYGLYVWTAGEPNLMGNNRLNVSIYYSDSLSRYIYDWVHNVGDGWQGIVLGHVAQGNSILTAGPTLVRYILRKPDGADSGATLNEGSTITTTITKDVTVVNVNGGVSVKWSTYKEDKETATGTWESNKSKLDFTISKDGKSVDISELSRDGTLTWSKPKYDLLWDVNVGFNFTHTKTTSDVEQYTRTLTRNISTKPGIYLGADGDVFIGESYDVSMGQALDLQVEMIGESMDSIRLRKKDIIAVGPRFKTEFAYTQLEIIDDIIPRTIEQRNSLLTTVAPEVYADTTIHNMSTEPLYYTALQPIDEQYGEEGTYRMLPPEKKGDWVYARNMVQHYNNEINNWRKQILENEKTKVESIRLGKNLKNLSVSGGVSYSDSFTETRDTTSSKSTHWDFSGVGNGDVDLSLVTGSKWFPTLSVNLTIGGGWTTTNSTSTSHTRTVSYNLGVDYGEMLSVDRVSATDGFGPVFHTRGGQTGCPYVGETKTQFYTDDNGKPYTIGEATLPTEVPKIRIVGQDYVHDVPAGETAYFTIQMSNASPVSGMATFNLRLDEKSNPDGAIITVDGEPLTAYADMPFNFSVQNGESSVYTKTIAVRQGRPNQLDYNNIALVLTSACNPLLTTDTARLSVHFVPECPSVKLDVENTIVNRQSHSHLPYTLSDYNATVDSMMSIRLQYRYGGEQLWRGIVTYTPDSLKTAAGYPIRGSWDMSNLLDGEYELRAVTVCNFTGENVYNETAKVTLVKDTVAPTNLGLPSPINGIYTSDNQIYVDFNEPIQPERLIAQNVKVRAVMNQHTLQHSVAIETSPNSVIYSEAETDFRHYDFTHEFWLNLPAAPTTESLIYGHRTNQEDAFRVSVTPDRHMVVSLSGQRYVSQTVLPLDEWMLFNLSYRPTDDTHAAMTLHCARTNESLLLIDAPEVPAYSGRGGMLIGDGYIFRMHDFASYQVVREWTTTLMEKNKSKDIYDPTLYAYYPMDEGTGTVIRDVIRSHNLVLNGANWWYHTTNYAIDVPQATAVPLHLERYALATNDEYVIECWFRSEADAQLLSLGGKAAISFRGTNMMLTVDSVQHILRLASPLADNRWHHFALRNHVGVPDVFIDGTPLKLVSAGQTGADVDFGIIYLGDSTNTATLSMDEIRIWHGYLSADFIRANRNSRLLGSENGLIAYYPMEQRSLNHQNQYETRFSLLSQNLGDTLNGQWHQVMLGDSTLQASATVPALLPTQPKEEVEHTVTASNTRLVVNITEQARRIEGCTLEMMVEDIVDQHGNYSKPIWWTAYVNRNQLIWDNPRIDISKPALTDTTFVVRILNNSGTTEHWQLQGLESWLTASETSGTLAPLSSRDILLTAHASMAVGRYENVIYLVGNQQVETPLYLSVQVCADRPDWSVNPAQFEYSMHMIAKVDIEQVPVSDTRDILAAFIDDKCVGVCSPQFYSNPIYNDYYFVMNIYANNPQNGKNVTFRYWSASSGLIYTPLESAINGKPVPVVFTPGNLYGSFTTPVQLSSTDLVEQVIHYQRGYNWVSYNIAFADNATLDSIYTDLGKIVVVKSQTSFAIYDSIRNTLRGSLHDIRITDGYVVEANAAHPESHIGHMIHPELHAIQLKEPQGWTWIGYLPRTILSLQAALSGHTPHAGDIIKSQRAFAIYDGNSWMGSLTEMAPGQGYRYYKSVAGKEEFYYPSPEAVSYLIARRVPQEQNSSFTPIDPALYQNNMILTAIVMNGDQVVTNAEVGVFADSECRAAAFADDGLYYLTIPGDEATTLRFEVVVNGNHYQLTRTIDFRADDMVGTPTNPYVLQIGVEEGLYETYDSVSAYKEIKDGVLRIHCNEMLYDAQGRLLNDK